jgi:hypothetical protein
VNRSLGLTFSLDPPYEGVFRAHVVVSDDRGDGELRTKSFLDLDVDELDLSGVLPPDPAPLYTVA